MHVLFLPKWYPGRNDPQLGDFIRKQALAVSGSVRTSVLFIHPLEGLERTRLFEEHTDGDLWELFAWYRASRASWAPWRKLVNLRRYTAAARAGRRRVLQARGPIDLVQAYILVRPALLARRWMRRFGTPYIVSEQSSQYLDGTYATRPKVQLRLMRDLVRDARALTVVSDRLGQAMRGFGLADHYTVVPNPIPGLDRPLPLPGPVGAFLVVADLVDRTKNVSGVLRALAAARATDTRAGLTVIGDGPDRRALEALAATLGIRDHVRFLGRLANSDVLEHMARAFCVVVNSRVETFSVVTGEGLASGRPVIASRCGGPEAFLTPENGILVPVEDDAALADAMRQVMRNAAAYDPAMIRRDLATRFSTDVVVQRLMDVYRTATGHG
ncbi:MAG: glycosyltransferase [Flavobacteriales bacterium]|nr:glycosyltransferase [Flavobacteriales bacterium]